MSKASFDQSQEPQTATTEEKKGDLFGGALTDETVESSRRVLDRMYGAGATTGLQQWFTPPSLSVFVGNVLSPVDAVLDLTAGNGALLRAYHRMARFGVEIDSDHTKEADYDAITGDAQKVVPMLRAAGVKFDKVAINPPFGLDWKDPAHKEKGQLNSTVLAYLWALDLLDSYGGHGAMICGRDRLYREVMRLEEASGIYAIVEVEGKVWDTKAASSLATAVAFFTRPSNAEPGLEVFRRSIHIDNLPNRNLSDEIRIHRSGVVRNDRSYTNAEQVRRQWDTVRKEWERRQQETRAAKKKGPRYDVALKGNKIHARPGAFSQMALRNNYREREIELLDRQAVQYFGTNPRAWKQLMEAVDNGWVTMDPSLPVRVEKELREAEKHSTPLFPLPDQMRLGWLTDLDAIKCIRTDEEKGFYAGQEYKLSTRTPVVRHKEQRMYTNKKGEPGLRWFETERRVLQIEIGEQEYVPYYKRGPDYDPNNQKEYALLSEGPEDIKWLISHFELPDPGDVASRWPELYQEARDVIDDIEAQHLKPRGYSFKRYQKDHMARLLIKGRGMLAHEQGLGKTLMQMTLAMATARLFPKCRDLALFTAPQDIIPQWGREANKFFGRKLIVIRTLGQARRYGQAIKRGFDGWFITHYELLSRVGATPKKKMRLPTVLIDGTYEWEDIDAEKAADPKRYTARRELHRRLSEYKAALHGGEVFPVEGATDHDACPRCRADTGYGWRGAVCDNCGYVHRRLYVKSGYTHLTTAFKQGIVLVDEVSEMRGDDSQRSKAVRALAAGAHRYGGTGTPLSNYINDAFWGMWFCGGNASVLFPYDYHGKSKFESDFCVIEYMMGDPEKYEDHKRARKKILPQITNVSQFWRLSQPFVSRLRKEDTGEPIVEKIIHPIRVPMGVEQQKMQAFWLKKFVDYFIWKYPNHPLVTYNLVGQWAKALGQLWRLESAATLPEHDEASQEWDVAQEALKNVSNYTPAMLKTLETAIERVEAGDKVLIGSDLIMTGKWIAERLQEKGIKAVHITEERGGRVGTKNPRARAAEVTDFVEGDAQVLCAGINAMKLGHNLDVASSVIIHGLPYSHMAFDQFVARVHRLTSRREVHVYVIVPHNSLAQRKWDLLRDKAGASDLAFDGHLVMQKEDAVDWGKVLEGMQKRGIRATGDEIHEEDVRKEWESRPNAVIPENLLKPAVIEVEAPLIEPDEIVVPEKPVAQPAQQSNTISLFDDDEEWFPEPTKPITFSELSLFD